jgi:hypothetical protein
MSKINTKLLLIQLISPTREFFITTTKLVRYMMPWIFNMKMYSVNAKQFAAKCHVVVKSDEFTCFILYIYPGKLLILNSTMCVCKKKESSNYTLLLSAHYAINAYLCGRIDIAK